MVSDGVPPNTKTFTALIGTFAKCGPLESALDTIQNVIQQDGSGSAIGTYAALMSACEKAGQWDLAIALFDRMTALVSTCSVSGSTITVQPTVQTEAPAAICQPVAAG